MASASPQLAPAPLATVDCKYISRRETRLRLAVPVRVLLCSDPEDGFLNSVTYDVSRNGMRIHAIRHARMDDEVIVERKGRRGSYKIVWMGDEHGKNLLGLQATGHDSVWDGEILELLDPSQKRVERSDVIAIPVANRRGIGRVLDWFGSERRGSSRSFKNGIELTYGATPEDQTMTTAVELSEHGMSFKSSRRFAAGQSLRIFLPIAGARNAHVSLRAEVRHCSGGVVGVQFLNVTGEKRDLLLKHFAKA